MGRYKKPGGTGTGLPSISIRLPSKDIVWLKKYTRLKKIPISEYIRNLIQKEKSRITDLEVEISYDADGEPVYEYHYAGTRGKETSSGDINQEEETKKEKLNATIDILQNDIRSAMKIVKELEIVYSASVTEQSKRRAKGEPIGLGLPPEHKLRISEVRKRLAGATPYFLSQLLSAVEVYVDNMRKLLAEKQSELEKMSP